MIRDKFKADLDKRFALLRDGAHWQAALISERGGAGPSFRISQKGVSRDARGEAEKITDIETVARQVILEGKRMRCARGREPANSLDLKGKGVTGYILDADIARALGVPTTGRSADDLKKFLARVAWIAPGACV